MEEQSNVLKKMGSRLTKLEEAKLKKAARVKKVPIKATPHKVLSLIGVEALSHPLLAFSDNELPPEGVTHTRPL